MTYKYRGKDKSDLHHRDNVGLRKCKDEGYPLIYFHGVDKGRYIAIYPVFIIEDIPERMEFKVAVDDMSVINTSMVEDPDSQDGRRKYVTREVKLRLHQAGFRERVLKAYRESCAFCRLKHIELLDAAHIIPDSEGGTAEVQNGMALCKIHHSAFDQNILGVDPDYKIHVREDILGKLMGQC